jgi:uncharacterized protein
MSWGKFLLLFVLSFAFAAGVSANPALEALNILDSSEQSLNSLEASTANSNRIISDLLLKTNSMQTTIGLQQRQLKQASENSRQQAQQWETKSQNYERTIQVLEDSYNLLLAQNMEQAEKITRLETANKLKSRLLAVLAAALGAALICPLILRFFKR